MANVGTSPGYDAQSMKRTSGLKVGLKVTLILSLSLFMVSLGMPALVFRGHAPVQGLTTLLWGWWGVFTGDFPWFANCAYFAAVIFACRKQRAVAMICCAIALGLGSLSH